MGTNITYAYDITQLVRHQDPSVGMVQRITIRKKNEKINTFGGKKRKKIQTNHTKFTVIRFASRKAKEFHSTAGRHNTADSGNILGLTISRRGYDNHIVRL